MTNIPVFLASNNKYAPFVATTMASICANTKEFVDFYILDSGINDNNKQKIRNTAKFFNNFNVEFVKVDCEKEFKDYPVIKHITRDMYSRFLIPSILPKAEKVIYSDIDVAFIGDIKELYDTDLEDKIIAAVPEYRKEAREQLSITKQKLNLNTNHKPFNSGLLCINCKKWNEHKLSEKLLHIAQQFVKQNILKYPDQDILNKFFDNNYLELDKKFCLFPKHIHSNFKDFDINNLIKHTVILHYAGGGMSKPWNNKELFCADKFWQYVYLTDFSSEIEHIYQQFNRRKFINKILQNIFSVRNSDDKKFKVIKIAGLEIKIHKITS